MFSYLKDKFQAARLKARYQRLVQEQVLDLLESGAPPQPVAEDSGRWMLLGNSQSLPNDSVRTEVRTRARQLAQNNPHARNLLRLLEIYVVGQEFKLHHAAMHPEDVPHELTKTADRLWRDFLIHNRKHFSYREYARRAWRDGECFLRKFPREEWPPTVRFIDPEFIDSPAGALDSHGIVTEPDDVETVVAYLHIDPQTAELREAIPPNDLFHTKLGVDSNQKRGQSIFASILSPLSCFDKWLETELTARKLQASIVLWRKVQGSPSQASAFADAAQSRTPTEPSRGGRREKYEAGTIVTTSQGTDLEFLQPNTNFGDAVPLGRLLLLCTSAGAGLPEFMLTSDASNGNFASTMVAEGPAVKLFQSEQHFFAGEFRPIWEWVMTEAIRAGRLPEEFFERVDCEWNFPALVSRDRNRDRLADVRLVDANILSRAEVARREGVEPITMRNELEDESQHGSRQSSHNVPSPNA